MSELPCTEIIDANPDCEIISIRTFNFTCEKVFRAWSEAAHLKNWWGPKGFTNTFHEFDFTEGGKWKFIMHGPDSVNYDNESQFVKIENPVLIVLNHISNPKFQVNARFEEVRGKTKLTFKMIFLSKELCEQLQPICIPSNEQNFDRLEAELSKMN
jgi:uncharacterized protein YndB with AHSA1/START domain